MVCTVAQGYRCAPRTSQSIPLDCTGYPPTLRSPFSASAAGSRDDSRWYGSCVASKGCGRRVGQTSFDSFGSLSLSRLPWRQHRHQDGPARVEENILSDDVRN
eukprot:9031784-Pyramimonas_sp.AAC.1